MITVENNQPPVVITPDNNPIEIVPQAPVIIEPSPQNALVVTQIPGVGPPGPKGEPGSSGTGAVDHEARDAIAVHLIDPTPHPVYDDMPDLTLLFENGLI